MDRKFTYVGTPHQKWEGYLRGKLPKVEHQEIAWPKLKYQKWKLRHVLPGIVVTLTLLGLGIALVPLAEMASLRLAFVLAHNLLVTVGAAADNVFGIPEQGGRLVCAILSLAGIQLFFMRYERYKYRDWKSQEEVQIYCEGAEDWRFSQRLRSCIHFGIAHANYLYPPLVNVISRSVSAGVLMSQYLRVYRATGSREEALEFVVSMRAVSMHIRVTFVRAIFTLVVLVATCWLVAL